MNCPDCVLFDDIGKSCSDKYWVSGPFMLSEEAFVLWALNSRVHT